MARRSRLLVLVILTTVAALSVPQMAEGSASASTVTAASVATQAQSAERLASRETARLDDVRAAHRTASARYTASKQRWRKAQAKVVTIKKRFKRTRKASDRRKLRSARAGAQSAKKSAAGDRRRLQAARQNLIDQRERTRQAQLRAEELRAELALVDRAAAASVAAGCGPELIAKTTGRYWECTFADNFDGTRIDRDVWYVTRTDQTGFVGAEACMVDDPSTVAVSDGRLRLTVRQTEEFVCKSPHGDFTTSYAAASVTTLGSFAQAFGRFEIRARFPDIRVPGIHGALWLYPAEPAYAFPRSGEIDIAEFYSVNGDRAIPFIHYRPTADDPTVTNNYCLLPRPGQYHSYVLEWTRKTLTISIDGTVCVRHTIRSVAPQRTPEPFDKPFSVVLTQSLGAAGNALIPGTTPLPASLDVDYVRVWK